MKKILLGIIMLLLMVGCATTSPPPASEPKDDGKKQEEPKSEEQPPQVEVDEILENEIFFEQDNVKMTYYGYEAADSGYGFAFMIDNDNDFDISVQTDDVYVNNTVEWYPAQLNIGANDRLDIMQVLFNDQLEKQGVLNNFEHLRLKFKVTRLDTMELMFETHVVGMAVE